MHGMIVLSDGSKNCLAKELTVMTVVLTVWCTGQALAQQWTTSGSNDIYNANTGGNVGIGTTTPRGLLEVQQTAVANGLLVRKDSANSITTPTASIIQLRNLNTTDN